MTQSLRQAIPQEIVALDGKALRRALNQDQSLQYVVSAWSQGNGLVLGQLKVADKSNEITAVPELLRVLELSGCIVTLDAMGCQKKIAQEISKLTPIMFWRSKANNSTPLGIMPICFDFWKFRCVCPGPVMGGH